MDFQDIIREKRDGQTLSEKEIGYLVKGISDGSLPDYQIAAWAMAVYFQGMDDRETRDLAMAMAYSGEVVDLSFIPGIKVDKHSTGGVGDKTTLIVTPLVAAAGIPVAKMSGRGLGHTGGTVDKYASIPGFQVERKFPDFIKQVQQVGAAVVSQSGNLVPADKRLYAIRDVTATVESIPLIASSIMSKKIASGANSIILDVKVGSGAFMKEQEKAEELARTMVEIGKRAGRRVISVLSDMEQPLGRMVGNALEVKEAIDTLKGRGSQDLLELSLVLASYMLILGGKTSSLEEARESVREILVSGRGWEKFQEMIAAQGGELKQEMENYGLPQALSKQEVKAAKSGYVSAVNAFLIGHTAMMLGAGRARLEDDIDYAVGVELLKKTGDPVQAGDTLALLHLNDEKRIEPASLEVSRAYIISPDPPQKKRLILDIIE
ncbi:MAG: pyrimidine-nucleoside phosphorylase [Syntrophomonadaceae bacterium]|nr:pyrimidine-nucleoside phosphorylase [Syntrophomonadaceae bacterium]